MNGGDYLESKHTLDGRVQRFATRLLLRTPRFVALRYALPNVTTISIGGLAIPPGSESTGFFWRGRAYNLYHITGPGGATVLDRFDVVERVRLGKGGVEFTDLLLDLLVSPLGEARFEDEDEVEAAHEQGLIDDRQRALIERTARHLARHHTRIIAAALAELAEGGGTAQREAGR